MIKVQLELNNKQNTIWENDALDIPPASPTLNYSWLHFTGHVLGGEYFMPLICPPVMDLT